MTLTDTGPLVGLVKKNDVNHAECKAALARLPMPLLTTCYCITEAMYLIGKDLGHAGQENLWEYVERGVLVVVELDEGRQGRMREFMTQYRDRPCDLADASLLTYAEATGATRIFSIDSDFLFYTLPGGRVLQVVPGPQR